nr:hypothetical protein [Burkholderia pseudomallei]
MAGKTPAAARRPARPGGSAPVRESGGGGGEGASMRARRAGKCRKWSCRQAGKRPDRARDEARRAADGPRDVAGEKRAGGEIVAAREAAAILAACRFFVTQGNPRKRGLSSLLLMAVG